MANRAYLRLWTREYGEPVMLDQFEKLLRTIPFSVKKPGILSLTIQPLDMSETPIADWDLHNQPLEPSAAISIAREHRSADTAYFARAFWDLWVYDTVSGRWHKQPSELAISCFGLEFDRSVCAELGHFEADLGFEHLFTGHAKLLGSREPAPVPEHPAEAEFAVVMSREENLRQYHAKARENIQTLANWVEAIGQALPLERVIRWSEGEEDFERRLEDILTTP